MSGCKVFSDVDKIVDAEFPSDADILEAMEKVRSGHKNGHRPKNFIAEEFEEMPAIHELCKSYMEPPARIELATC
jgi:hypothetical protein